MDELKKHLERRWKLIESFYDAEPKGYSKMSPNKIVMYVPFARIDGQNKSLVASNSDGYYGYYSQDEAKKRIERAKMLSGYSDAESFYIAVMSGSKVLDYIEV